VRILLVEDEFTMAQLLQEGLREEGHDVTVCGNGREAFEIASHWPFDVIILDVMLPGMDGFEVARRLRKSRNQTPILMLTARDSTKDLIHGLDIGADDYLTKPFSLEILFARVRAVGRRGPISQPVCLQKGDLFMDLGTREVRRGSRLITLTPREFSILEILMRHSPHVLSREALIQGVWGADSNVENNTLDAFIRLVRAKIEAGRESKLLHTIRGIGYAIRLENQ
jgi:DNA-binding response OmpR family regulator